MKELGRRVLVPSDADISAVSKGAWRNGNPFSESYMNSYRLYTGEHPMCNGYKWCSIGVSIGTDYENDRNIMVEILRSNTKTVSPSGWVYWKDRTPSSNDEVEGYWYKLPDAYINGGFFSCIYTELPELKDISSEYVPMVREMIEQICEVAKTKCEINLDRYLGLYDEIVGGC